MKKRIRLIADWFRKKPIFNNGMKNGNYIKQFYADIICVTSSGIKNISKVITKNTEVFDARPLEAFALEYDFLVRINKSCIINILMINQRADWNVVWIDEREFKVGKNYRKPLQIACEKIL